MKIRVKVKANQEKQEIKKKGNKYKIKLKEEAKNNKANKELINLLAKYFNVPARSIQIKSGLSSRNKLLMLRDEFSR